MCFVKQTFEKNAGGARTQGQHGRPSDAKKRKHVKTLCENHVLFASVCFPAPFQSSLLPLPLAHRSVTDLGQHRDASKAAVACCCCCLEENILLPTGCFLQLKTKQLSTSSVKKTQKKNANAEILCDIYMWPQTHFLRDKLDQSKTHSCMFYGSLWLSH